jgi:hypothetical protein
LIFNIYRRLLGFDEELAHSTHAKGIVRGFRDAADLDSVFMDHVPVGFCVPLGVIDVPPERFEERVKEIPPKLCLVIASGVVGIAVGIEAVHKLADAVRSRICRFCESILKYHMLLIVCNAMTLKC